MSAELAVKAGALRAICLAFACLCATYAGAQTGSSGLPAGESVLRVQLLNGRTGRPVVGARVLLLGDSGLALDGSHRSGARPTDGEGYLLLPAIVNTREVHLFVAGYVPCTHNARRGFPLEAIAVHGFVSSNECSDRIRLYPQRGLLVFFVRPQHWWEAIRH